MTDALYLAELTVYDRSLATTRVLRYANGVTGFITEPSDTPANTLYEPRIMQPVDVARDLFSQNATLGRTRVGYGDLVLNNADGLLDDLLDYGFDGRDIVVYRSEATDPAYPADFEPVFTGTMEQPVHAGATVTIKLRDRQFEVLTPFQSTKYAGTNALPAGLEGVADDIKGKPKPVCFGQVMNVSPPCVNTSKLIYQVNDGAVASVGAVCDRGIPLIGATWTSRTSGFGGTDPVLAVDHSTTLRLFVIVGDSGKLATSPDGETWTLRTSTFGSSHIKDVTWIRALNLWVIVGDDGKIATSPDGITWTARTSGTASGLVAVTYGNGVLVAVNNANDAFTSTDAVSWTTQANVFGTDVTYSVGFGNGLFVACGTDAGVTVGTIWTSTDGASWTSRTSNIASGRIYRPVYADGRWIVCSDNGRIALSVDGITWTQRQADFATGEALYGVVHTGYLYAAVGTSGTLGTSPDGGTWTDRSSASGFGASFIRDIAYGDGVFVLVGDASKVSTSSYATYASQADLLDDSLAPAPGEAKAYLTGGYIRLGSPPAGLITADVTEGSNAAARTTAQVFKRILEREGYTTGDWNATDLTDLDSANSAVIGYWTDKETTTASVLDAVSASVGAWWGADIDGVFRIRQFTAPSGSPVLSLTENDLQATPVKLVSDDPGAGIPVFRSIVKWGRNYTPQTSDLADGVEDDRRTEIAKEWREVPATDTTIQTVHPLAVELREDTLLSTEAAASAEATRRLALRSTDRALYQIVLDLTTANLVADLGTVIELSHPRFGFGVLGSDDGTLFRVVGVRPNAAAGTLTLTIWGRNVVSKNRVTTDAVYRITTDGHYRITKAIA